MMRAPGSRINVWRIASAVALLCGAASPAVAGAGGSAVRFHLRIAYASSVPGDVVTYTATPDTIVVTYEDSGSKRRELLRSRVTEGQARRLHARMQGLPPGALRPDPGGDDIEDGFEITFDIRTDDRPARRIVLKNGWHPALRDLCLELNTLLPEGMGINAPSTETENR